MMLAGALTHMLAAADQAAAQRMLDPDGIRHIQTVEPRSGPRGTLVEVSTLNLALQAKVHVGIGATQTGFESLAEAPQGELGEISVSVRIPETAPSDRAVVFVAFNAIFSPIGMSDPFHVTDGDGLLRRTGRVVREEGDGSCLSFRDGDDFPYRLTGKVDALRPGSQVVIEGSYTDGGPCGPGDTIDVVRVVR
jgi:hypothetical protein